MSHSKKKTKTTKEEIFNVRCTTKQRATLEAVAEREGLGLSTWVLHAALRTAEARQTEARR